MTADDTARGAGSYVITGAGRGLGLATAQALLSTDPGCHVVAAVRDPTAPALGGRLGAAGDRVHLLQCDVADLASVRAAASRLIGMVQDGTVPSLRALIGNAGIQAGSATGRTEDGFERTFATNVLGHFLLIRLLEPHLEPPARIVMVSSGTHRGDFAHSGGMVPKPRWQDPEVLARPSVAADAGTGTAGKRAYTTSKLAVVHLVHELARRLPVGVEAFSFDPGMMPGTGLAREGSALERAMWHSMMHLMRVMPNVTNPADAGRHLAELVTGPAPAESGAYVELGRVLRSSDESYDREREQHLWQTAEQLVGLDEDEKVRSTT